MTNEQTQPAEGTAPVTPAVHDRVYRSAGALAGGVLLLAVAAWLGVDGVLVGTGRTRWGILAGLLAVVPLVVAFTLRPAVFAGPHGMRVRNPFRTITVPWTSVEGLRAVYSTEVVADGRKYTLWSIPVSVRARRSARHHNARLAAGDKRTSGAPREAPTDQSLAELRELAERHGTAEPTATVTSTWSWEVLAPTAAGALALVLLNVL